MKRTIIVTLFLMLAVVAFSQTVPRVVRQQLILDPAYPVDILDHITNTGQTHNPNYVLRVENINTGVEKGTDLANCPPSVIRIFKSGNDSVGWTVNAIFNQSMWPAAWIPGEQLKIKIWYTVDTGIAAGVDPYPNYEYVEKILEVPTGTGSVQLTDAADRLIIPPAPQGAPTYQFTVTSNYAGAQIWKDGADTGEVTPHTFTGETADVAGVYTVVMDDVVWTPENYNYAGTADETVVFMGVKTPGFATNPYPADQADIEIAHDAAATTYNLTWEAPAGLVPDGYKIIWGENAAVDLGDALTWTTPEIAEGTYTWSVIPYITDPAAPAKGLTRGAVEQTRSMPALQAKVVHQTKGEPAGAPIWSFTITRQDAPPQEFNLTVKSNYVGSAIYKDNVDTGQVTPWTFSGFTADIAGVYKVVRAETDWAPAEYTYDGLADAEVVFMGTMTPGQAWDPVPQHDTIITLASGVDPKPWTLRWQHPTTGPAHEGYRLYWCEDNTDNPTIYNLGADVTTWETPALDAGHYYWKVVAYITDPPAPAKAAKAGNVIETAVKASLVGPGIKGDAPGYTPEYWHFEVQHEAGPATYSLTVVAMTSTNQLLTAAIYKDNVDTGQTTIHTFNDITANVAGTYHVVLDGWTFDPANFVYDGTYNHTVTFIGTEDGGETLPVELSSFTATLTAQNFVKLTWVSQTETGMWGYRVYRGESADQASSVSITPVLIPATNTSTMQVYSLEDREVEIGTTYWYWVEAVEITGIGQFHGPVSVRVDIEVPPVLPPTVTSMGNAYPNPFKQASSTSIDVRIKAGENGTVTIYNILGQAVKTFRVNEGNHKLTWNGKDARGNNCGSGIYFYKLSTPSKNVTKKMVIVK